MLIDLLEGNPYIINPDFNPFLGAHILSKEELKQFEGFKIGVNSKVCKFRNEFKKMDKKICAILVSDKKNKDYLTRLEQFKKWKQTYGYNIIPTSEDNVDFQKSSLLITCKSRSNATTIELIKKNWGKIFITTNHFYTLNKKMRSTISNLQTEQVLVIAFNKEDALSFNRLTKKDFTYKLVPPIVDERFKDFGSTRNIKISTSGSLHSIRGDRGVWNPNNDKYMYNGRMLIDRYTKKLDIDSRITVINRSNNIFSRIKRNLFFKEYDCSNHKYYKFDLPEFLNNSDFYFCPEDIWGVLPLQGWEALACGCILVLSDQTADKSYGFKSDFNYISIGKEWTLRTLSKTIDKIKELSDEDVKLLHYNSKNLSEKLNNYSNKFWEINNQR